MSKQLSKILSLSYDSAAATKSSALKTYFRSVRLIKDIGTVNPKQPSYITNVLLCGNCIDPSNIYDGTRNIYVFYIDTVFHSAWIIEINIDSRQQAVVYYDKYNAIGFDANHKIRNAKVVHGRLIWTDNLNPIYQMDIQRAKNSFNYKIGYGQFPNTSEWSSIGSYSLGQIVSNGNNFYRSKIYNNINHEPRLDSYTVNEGTYWSRLCLIEDAYYSMNVTNFYFEAMPPKHPPVVVYKSDASRNINNLKQTLFQFAYRYIYMDYRVSTFSPASILALPQAEEETATGLANEVTSLNNVLIITVNTGGEEVRSIEIIGRSSADPSKWFLIETVDKFSEEERKNIAGIGEMSITVKVANMSIGLAVQKPTETGTNIVNPTDVGLSVAIMTALPLNIYLTASPHDFTWNASDSTIAAKKNSTIALVGLAGAPVYLTAKPSWITIIKVSDSSVINLGDPITNGEVIGLYPNSVNTGVDQNGTVVITETEGSNTCTIFVEQLISPLAPAVAISVSDDDTSQLTISDTSGTATNGSTWINATFTPNCPGFGSLTNYTIYYTLYKNGTVVGTGSFGVTNNTSGSHDLQMNSVAAPGDTILVVIWQSTDVVPPPPPPPPTPVDHTSFPNYIGLGILQPSSGSVIHNTYLTASVVSMSWTATQTGANALATTITVNGGSNAYMIYKPDWIDILRSSDSTLVVNGNNIIASGEVLQIYPDSVNTGVYRSDNIIIQDAVGNQITIFVEQLISTTQPAIMIAVLAEDTSGLTIDDDGNDMVTINSPNITIDFTPHCPLFNSLTNFTMYYTIYKDGLIVGTGTFTATNEAENVIPLTMSSNATAGQTIVVVIWVSH